MCVSINTFTKVVQLLTRAVIWHEKHICFRVINGSLVHFLLCASFSHTRQVKRANHIKTLHIKVTFAFHSINENSEQLNSIIYIHCCILQKLCLTLEYRDAEELILVLHGYHKLLTERELEILQDHSILQQQQQQQQEEEQQGMYRKKISLFDDLSSKKVQFFVLIFSFENVNMARK